MAGIYIHIPFCKQACHYCDFHFSTSVKQQPDMVQALALELNLQASYLGEQTVNTIYFGGGTPSLLSEAQLILLIRTLHEVFPVHPLAEITMEANPDDLSPGHLDSLLSAGINRLSLGIQTFDENVLQWMNRAHNRQQALKVIPQARSAGFDNISMDLIYGVPHNDYSLENDLQITQSLQPEHISAYHLTIEAKTVFGHQKSRGLLKEISEDASAQDFENLIGYLHSLGYLHYEISNFAKRGKESRHNSSYWLQEHYLGIGPGAHSYNGDTRHYNVSNNSLYLKAINKGNIPYKIETLSRVQKINEMIMTRLRTSIGLDLVQLMEHHQWDLLAHHEAYLQHLTSREFVEIEKNTLILTTKGKLIADQIASDLFLTE